MAVRRIRQSRAFAIFMAAVLCVGLWPSMPAPVRATDSSAPPRVLDATAALLGVLALGFFVLGSHARKAM